jgi:putative membrane protein
MSEPDFRRLHPASILIELVKVLKTLSFVLLILAMQCMRGAPGERTEIWFALLGLAGVASAYIRYISFRYAVVGGSLIIRQGIITKKNRTIPIDRIQNINITKSFIHRVLGVVQVQIETAGGSEAEAALPAVNEDEAQELKRRLLVSDAAPPVAGEVQTDGRVLYQATPKELFLAGATQNRALAIIAGFGGLVGVAANAGLMNDNQIVDGVKQANAPWMAWGFIAVLLLLAGWALSIGSAFFVYWGFELTAREGRLRRRYGLVNQVENVIPLRRVQVVRISQTLIQRFMKLCQMHVETAGSFASGKADNGQQAQSSTNSTVSPLMEMSSAGSLIHEILPDLDYSDREWSEISRKTVLRHMRSAIIFSLVVTGGLWFVIDTWALAAVPAVLGLAALTGYLRQRTVGWSMSEGIFASRSGVMGRQHHFAPLSKVQSVTVFQSPAQRGFGLATLTFRTASMSGSAAVEVLDLEEETANSLADHIKVVSSELAWLNPDGF